MERHIGAEPVRDPFRERGDLRRAIIVAGDQQRRDLQPDTGFALDVFEGLENGFELDGAERSIETIGESLQIDVGSVITEKNSSRAFSGYNPQ